MYRVGVSDHIMVAHSLRGETFGPAQRLHGATYEVKVEVEAPELDADGIVIDIGLLRTVLRPRLAGTSGPRPVVPDVHREWLETQARRVQRALAAGDYPVVGDLDALLPRWPAVSPADRGNRSLAGVATADNHQARPTSPAGEAVLNLALDLLLDPAPGPSGEDR